MNKFFSVLLMGVLCVLAGCRCSKKTTCGTNSCPTKEDSITVERVPSKILRVSGSHPKEVNWDREDLK